NYNSLASQNFQAKISKATIYPNPTSDNFTIEMENEVKSVEIYSLLGQKVLSANTKNTNVSSLPKGVYLVRIEDTNNTTTNQKLIIE
ncbi:MAG TPA: T9SS type A sorting domain-containing protein, partial [Flavobacterium alvei]|nr:T9SS type A sorting domain-containing protein [Flavobacterium alvei]